MHEIMQDQCCSVPEALMIMEVVPLCEIGRLRGDEEMERLVERVALGKVDPISSTQGLPVRCASVISCQDALGLARQLNAFAF